MDCACSSLSRWVSCARFGLCDIGPHQFEGVSSPQTLGRCGRGEVANSRRAEFQPPSVPKPTKADVEKVVQIVTSDEAKTQSYCDLNELYDQLQAAVQKNDSKTVQALGRQADALLGKLGPEYSKLMDGLDQVDPNSSEGKEFISILSGTK